MQALVIAEHNNKTFSQSLHALLKAATKLAQVIDVAVIGHECENIALEIATLANVDRVLCANHPNYQNQLAENSSVLLKELSENYAYILAPANTFGKNLLPRLAGLMQTEMLSDVIEIIDAETFVRPLYAGNILAEVKMRTRQKLLTIRASAFKADKTNKEQAAPIVTIDTIIENNSTQFIKREVTKLSARPELSNAKIVIAGGRGLKSAENFKKLEEIADLLGAAIGASRAAVDAGYAPNDYQIGQTGKIIAPDVYIAVGISGAIQHLAGMRESRTIIAINNDPDAPIMKEADFALVADLFTILPQWLEQLSAK